MNCILSIITLVHILYILFVVVVPFTNNTYLLFMHSIIVPFMIFHWVINNNMCALTLLEHHMRNQINGAPVDKSECFTAKLVEPIYDFKQNHEQFSTFIYAVTIGLWLISVGKLIKKYRDGEINSLHDLLTN